MTTYRGWIMNDVRGELCPECTGSGIMAGNCPCKICMGTGHVKPVPRKSKEELDAMINEALSKKESTLTI